MVMQRLANSSQLALPILVEQERGNCLSVRWTLVLEECLAVFGELIHSLFRLELFFFSGHYTKMPGLSGILSINKE